MPAPMPELTPAAPGSPPSGRLTIYYRKPLIVEHWPFPVNEGAIWEIYPAGGREVDHFRITVIPSEVPDA